MKLKPGCQYYCTDHKALCIHQSSPGTGRRTKPLSAAAWATLALCNLGPRKHRAGMEFLQFSQRTSWIQQPYPSSKQFYIACKLNSKICLTSLTGRDLLVLHQAKLTGQVTKFRQINIRQHLENRKPGYIPSNVLLPHHISTESHF